MIQQSIFFLFISCFKSELLYVSLSTDLNLTAKYTIKEFSSSVKLSRCRTEFLCLFLNKFIEYVYKEFHINIYSLIYNANPDII